MMDEQFNKSTGILIYMLNKNPFFILPCRKSHDAQEDDYLLLETKVEYCTIR
jgi:hypothetical protein